MIIYFVNVVFPVVSSCKISTTHN